jgi:integrase
MVRGIRASASFTTKAQAAAWALQREAELSGTAAHSGTVADVLKRYAREVSPTHRGERWETTRLTRLERDPLAAVSLAALSPVQIAAWRERRLRTVSGASVRREMNLLGAAFEVARREWGWLPTNPMRDVKKPPSPPSRRRRITDDEIDRLTIAFGLDDGLHADTAMQRTGLAFMLSLESAMRASEIASISPDTANLDGRFVTLPKTKNGDRRDVPLSARAVEILKTLPVLSFDLNPGTRDVLFRRARDAAKIPDLHFHDARAEAIWRLSKKLDVLELARMIGHRDPRSLMMYYNASATELAMRLDGAEPMHPLPTPSSGDGRP